MTALLFAALLASPLVVAALEAHTRRALPRIKRTRSHKKALKQMSQANQILEDSHRAKQTRHYTEHDGWDEDYRRILRPKEVTGAVIRTGTGTELSSKGFLRPEPWSQTPPVRLLAAQRWYREMEINPVMASINYLGWNDEQCASKTTDDLVSAVEAQLRKDGGFD